MIHFGIDHKRGIIGLPGGSILDWKAWRETESDQSMSSPMRTAAYRQHQSLLNSHCHSIKRDNSGMICIGFIIQSCLFYFEPAQHAAGRL